MHSMRRALTVTSGDRLVSTLFLAGVAHALVILGITFELPKPKQASKSLEIALVRQQTDRKPKKADFLAQANMLGSGESIEKKKIEKRSLPQPAQQKKVEKVVEVKKPPAPKPVPRSASQKKVLTQKKSVKKIATAEKKENKKALPKISAASLAMQIAELSKELSLKEQNYSRRPRIKFINSINAHKYMAAQYEAEWQKKIERVGNLNYPDEARRKQLSGRLLLVVWINSDGSLVKIKLRRSSGHKVLDDAAIRIVRLAAPFAAFPQEIRKEADQLVITRTWRFASDKVSTK